MGERLGPPSQFAASALVTAALLLQRRLVCPTGRVGALLHFEDGTTARVYRETVKTGSACVEPALLVVQFRLKLIGLNPIMHSAFRAESILNTPLFAGFPGFRSKLWCDDAATGIYRGIYQWDGAQRARSYADTLLRLLALVSEESLLRYQVVPETYRDDYLRDPAPVKQRAGDSGSGAWWRLKEGAAQWSTS